MAAQVMFNATEEQVTAFAQAAAASDAAVESMVIASQVRFLPHTG